MSSWMKLVVALAVGAVVALIAATIVVGSKVREETVVAHPYEEGLHHDAERTARAALGLGVAIDDDSPVAGTSAPLGFRLGDREGKPVAGARVAVELSRPDTSRGEVRAEARELTPGRYAADVAFPAPGTWDVRFDVRRGNDRVRLERRVTAHAPCDLGAGPCAASFEGMGEVVALDVAPRPIRTMSELEVRVSVRSGICVDSGCPPADAQAVTVSFSMPGMEMGENRAALARTAPGEFAGKAVLVRCPSGRADWVAAVSVTLPGGRVREARFPLRVDR